jgi:hypothetical protein
VPVAWTIGNGPSYRHDRNGQDRFREDLALREILHRRALVRRGLRAALIAHIRE